MGTKEALQEHLAVPIERICSFQPLQPASVDPEDGITSDIEETLNERKAESKIDCWESLW